MEKAKAREEMRDGAAGMEAHLVGIQTPMQEEHLKQVEAEASPTSMPKLRMTLDVPGLASYVDLLTLSMNGLKGKCTSRTNAL